MVMLYPCLSTVTAYNGLTGAQLWSYATQGSIDFVAVGLDGALVVTSEDDNLYVLRST